MIHRKVQYQCFVHAISKAVTFSPLSIYYENEALLAILHDNRTGTSIGNRTGTIGKNGSWSLFLSRINVNISTWYYTFPFVPVLVPAPVSMIVDT